jgi:hypothetical protein
MVLLMALVQSVIRRVCFFVLQVEKIQAEHVGGTR